MSVAYQLSHATLREHRCLQKCEWGKKGATKAATVHFVLPSRTASQLTCLRGRSSTVAVCSGLEPTNAASVEGGIPFPSKEDSTGPTEMSECPPSNTTSISDSFPSTNQLHSSYLPCSHEHGDGHHHDATSDASTTITSSETGAKMEKGRIRRFSLTEPDLKTINEEKLTPIEKGNFDKVMKFRITNNNLGGRLVIQTVRTEHMKDLETLLTDSYSELMWGPLTYKPALAWIVSTYLRERQACFPNASTLVGLYSPSEETCMDEKSSTRWWLAGAVEISFNASGKPKNMLTPLPPENAPFLSNMAVLKKFRRRGIGRELLKGAEQLTLEMGGSEMYLHCRMISDVPLNMYKSSGYSVVETDSILSLLLFQQRQHLMYKRLGECLNKELEV